jgi:hypothetical protein
MNTENTANMANEEKIDERFFSSMINPITDFTHPKLEMYLFWLKFFDKDPAPLVELYPKRIYFIPVSKFISTGGEAEYLAGFNKKPVLYEKNYLSGIIVQLAHKKEVEHFLFKTLVNIRPKVEYHRQGFEKVTVLPCLSTLSSLGIQFSVYGKMIKCMARTGKFPIPWTQFDRWVFLAEDL